MPNSFPLMKMGFSQWSHINTISRLQNDIHTVNKSIKPTNEIVAEQNDTYYTTQYSRTSPFAAYHLVPINVLNITLSSCLLTEFSTKHIYLICAAGILLFWQNPSNSAVLWYDLRVHCYLFNLQQWITLYHNSLSTLTIHCYFSMRQLLFHPGN